MFVFYLINLYCVELLECLQFVDIVYFIDDVVCKGSVWCIVYCVSKVGLDNLILLFVVCFVLRIKVNVILLVLVMFNDGDDVEYCVCILVKFVFGIELGLEVIYQSFCYLLDNFYVIGIILIVNGGCYVK